MPAELVAALLVWARVAPLAFALARFTRGFVPLVVALSASLALALVLVSSAGPAPELTSMTTLLAALLRELAIGATFALALAFALLAAPWALALSDAHAAHAELRAVLARPYALCAAWLVLALEGPLALVTGLAQSFRDAPLAVPTLSARAFAFGVAQLAGDALVTALGFALPLLVSMWLTTLTLALVHKALAPRGLAATGFSGLLLTLLASLLLVPIAGRAPEGVRQAIEAARALTRAFAG